MEEKTWDAVVIGTGIGGGTIGRALAEKGLSVLFVEKGAAGFRAETTSMTGVFEDPVARMARGFWPDRIEARLDGQTSSFFAPLGSGVGGSSVFYAAALERPERHDLDDVPERPHPTGGWPVSYSVMQPYFDAAEAMYHVCGTPDPISGIACPSLAPPPPVPPGDAAIMNRLRANGLHPYHLHTAMRYLAGCRECRGNKCPLPCKMDGRSAGVEPALATGRAEVLDRCEVSRILTDGDKVTGVQALRNGQVITLAAHRVILAAGALSSPRVLMASGIKDRSGLIGRNLMFHLNEIFAIWPRRSESFDKPSKSIGFRDLYHAEGQRLGMVQAMGLDVRYGEIVQYLRMRLARSVFRNVRLIREMTRVPALIAAKVLGNAKVFVGLLEDPPLTSNRVIFDPDRPGQILFEYRLTPELLSRRKTFRRLIGRAFKGQRSLFLTHRPEPNFGHPCGTLRFGLDPETSVLDPDCQLHGMANLYVTDASFMPTSMGVNPSLTIAANALRVADRIVEKKAWSVS